MTISSVVYHFSEYTAFLAVFLRKVPAIPVHNSGTKKSRKSEFDEKIVQVMCCFKFSG